MDKVKLKKISQFINSFTVCKSELLSEYDDGYLGKKVYKVELNDGTIRQYEQITKNKGDGDAVVIIPITDEGNFVMVVESRPNTRETVLIGFPAGMVDVGEEYIESAKRELLEETGYKADDMYELEWHYQDCGCSKAIIRTYVALNCKKVQDKNLNGNEKLDYIELSYEDILELFNENKINDANAKIAFMNYTLKKIDGVK